MQSIRRRPRTAYSPLRCASVEMTADASTCLEHLLQRRLPRAILNRASYPSRRSFLSCRPEWRHLSLFNLTTVRDLTRALPERSPVSSLLPGWWSRPAAHPPASPHGAFSTSLRLGRNDRAHRTSNIEYLAPTITMRLPASMFAWH